MNRRAAGWVLGIALLLVLGTAARWWLSRRAGGREAGRPGAVEAAGGGTAGERHSFELYFPAGNGGLRAERRELQVTEEPKDRIRKLGLALLAGPTTATTAAPRSVEGAAAGAAAGSGLTRPFPPEVELGSVQLSPDGTAFVELRWPGHDDPPESGSTEEIQRVYSLVDSLALNVPEVRRVVLLWNGTQRLTFAGHLDTSRPLVPDRTLLAP
jgi:Sporulation and spore germination